MITLAICATVFLLGICKIVADRPHTPPDPELDAIREKMRVLERQRNEWRESLADENDRDHRIVITVRMTEVEERMISVAGEMAELGRHRAKRTEEE